MASKPQDDRELTFERMRGAKAIIPAISGFNHAYQKALEIAAFMDIVNGTPLTEKEILKLRREFENDT